jgi:hypothetical protein
VQHIDIFYEKKKMIDIIKGPAASFFCEAQKEQSFEGFPSTFAATATATAAQFHGISLT